jgi:hypothetical protein
MKWKLGFMAVGLAAALQAPVANAADHLDGSTTGVKADASTDINDVYSWMSSDGKYVNLIMTVSPAADKNTAKFSTAANYVFHTASRSAFSSMQATPLDIICQFDATQNISCWVGDNTNFVSGNANTTAGLSSADGKIKVYAGPRKDHFFFNLDGYNQVRTCVKATTPVPTPDAKGCFAMSGTNAGGLTTAQTMAIRTQLAKAPPPAGVNTCTGTGNPVDFFANLNTLAIVMQIDLTLLNKGGKYVSVWGATHKKM